MEGAGRIPPSPSAGLAKRGCAVAGGMLRRPVPQLLPGESWSPSALSTQRTLGSTHKASCTLRITRGHPAPWCQEPSPGLNHVPSLSPSPLASPMALGLHRDGGSWPSRGPRRWLAGDGAHCAEPARRGCAAKRADVRGAGLGRPQHQDQELPLVPGCGRAGAGFGGVTGLDRLCPAGSSTEGCSLRCSLHQAPWCQLQQPKSHSVQQS